MPFVDLIAWILFSGLLFAAALSDGRTLTIPNRLCLAVAFLYLARLPVLGVTDWSLGLLAGVCVLLVGFVLFARGWFGGGDVKLLTAVALWAGPGQLLPMLVVTGLAGGVLAIAMLLRHRTAIMARAFHDPASTNGGMALELPYGIAIASGGWWVSMAAFGAVPGGF